MDNTDWTNGSSGRRVCIAEQAIVVTGVQMVGANIHRYAAAASFLNALAGILLQSQVSAEKFNKQIIGDTCALPDGGFIGKRIQNIFFTAKHQMDITGSENPFYFVDNLPLGSQRWIKKRKTRQGCQALFDFAIGIHKAGNTPLDSELGCLCRNALHIAEIILNPLIVGTGLKKANGVKPPVNHPGSELLAELFELVQAGIQWGHMGLKLRRFRIDGEVKKKIVAGLLQFRAVIFF